MELKIENASIDICTRCQLKCVSCSTSKGLIRNGFIKEGYMYFKDFKYIIENNPYIKTIELSNWGEIFLNPEIHDILKYSFEHEINLYCANGSNFNHVPDKILEDLVKYKFRCLNLSIDGASQETYEQYRIHGSYYKVIENIRRLNYYKTIYNSEYPKLSWQFIIFGHNEHEINKVKELCNELHMIFNPKMNHSEFSPIKNTEKVKNDAGIDYASRKEYKEKMKTEYKHPCYQCLHSPQINWNGEVLGCCVNKWKGLGNIKDMNLLQIVQSKTYQFMIDVLCGREKANDSIPCYFCPNLKKISESPLNEEGLKRYKDYVPIALR